jgi:hypothetical protein
MAQAGRLQILLTPKNTDGPIRGCDFSAPLAFFCGAPQIFPRRIFLPISLLRSLRLLAANCFDFRVSAPTRPSKIANRKSKIKNSVIESIESTEALEESPHLCHDALVC